MAGSLFDKLKEKLPLDKLKNIKFDLPFLKKKKVDSGADGNEGAPHKKQADVGLADKNTHLSDKTDPGVPVGDKTEAEVSVADLGEPEKKPGLLQTLKHTKLSPVKIIVLLCVVYLIYDTLLGESTPEEEPAPVEVPRPKRKKRNKPAVDAAATGTPASTTAEQAVEPGTLPPAEAGGTPLPADPVDNIDVAATPAPAASPTVNPDETPAVADATPTPEPTATSGSLDDINLDDINKEADKNEKQQEEKVAETPTPEATSSIPSLSDIAEDKSETGETTEKVEKKEGDIADDLLKNIQDEATPSPTESKASTATEPPDYLKPGRGLVYNCKGKHWACLSRDQYSQCKNNRLWNEQNDKPSECHDVSVLATEKDCSTAQKIKIESLAKTNFCK